MRRLSQSRFNPAPGIKDFWHEFRKPNPYRWPILFVSTVPFMVIFWWLSSETVYANPERPQITYIETLSPDRSDEEIMASNLANQELKDLREARQAELEQRKRDAYKALGAATGIDVEAAERRGERARAEREAAEQARLDEMFGRTGEESEESSQDAASESSAP